MDNKNESKAGFSHFWSCFQNLSLDRTSKASCRDEEATGRHIEEICPDSVQDRFLKQVKKSLQRTNSHSETLLPFYGRVSRSLSSLV